MKKSEKTAEREAEAACDCGKEKPSALRRVGAVLSGTYLLYRSFKKRRPIKGIRAGYKIFCAVTGKPLPKA